MAQVLAGEKNRNEVVPMTQARRILVADDEHLVAMGVASFLEQLGYEVCGPASDGTSALELARSDQPDIALLDIRMPGLDGLACAAMLWRELGIPSIILSAYSSTRYVEEAQKAGVFGYLLKPVTGEALRAAIGIAWVRAESQSAQAKRIGQLEQSLAVRKTVEMAKWKIIQATGLSEPEAHGLLQRTARSDRRRLVDLAQEVMSDEGHALRRRPSSA